MQNHEVVNGAFGYDNNRLGNVGASNMNWTPRNPSRGYYHGNSSSVASPTIPNGCDTDSLRIQALARRPNNVPIPGMFPTRDPRSIPGERICDRCGSTSTPLWREGPEAAKVNQS